MEMRRDRTGESLTDRHRRRSRQPLIMGVMLVALVAVAASPPPLASAVTSDETTGRRHPQIKICGLTQPQEAASCAAGGADAIGYIFYPPSPRSITNGGALR